MGARGVTACPDAGLRASADRAGSAARSRERAAWPRTPPRLDQVIFKGVGEGRPYPDHALTHTEWAAVAPRQVRLADLVTTKRTLDLETLLDEQSTFYGDLFAHVVKWQGVMYLEDGLHRALRTALHGRPLLHARVLDLDDPAASSRRSTDAKTRGATR